MLRRLATGIAALALLGIGGAQAGEEEFCSKQYTLEEHSILEWAAIGGDPHAQYAIAQCAYPQGAGKLEPAQNVYALKWLMLATCDASGSPAVEERDRLTRKLKFSSDLSFRRFSGLTSDERFTAREKEFVSFRAEKNADLEARLKRLRGKTSAAEEAAARESLSGQLARMGGLGLVRLAELTSCRNFGASPSFSAAAWAAADYVWNTDELASVYGESLKDGWTIAGESTERFAALSQAEKRTAAFERARLLKSTPSFISRLEEDAALGRMQRLGIAHASPSGSPLIGNTATLAAQYALEALGFMEFVNGPDNDYGPTTIEAVKRAQAYYGVEETRWLSHRELRRTVCDAATKKADPVSFFHLALMFSQGWGYPQDIPRASYAIDRAEKLLAARLSRPDDLASWKRAEYPKFAPQIARAKANIDAEYAALPAHVSAGGSVSDQTLCQ